jgi:hypothetical protein
MNIEMNLKLVNRLKFAKLKAYFPKQWFRRIGVDEISVHGTDFTTNNPPLYFFIKTRIYGEKTRRYGKNQKKRGDMGKYLFQKRGDIGK